MMLIEFEMWASRIQHLVDTWSCHVVISWSIFGAWRTADARSWKIQGESVGGGRINRTRFLRCWFFVTRRVQFIHKQKKYIYIYTYIAKLKLLGLLRCFFFCLLFFLLINRLDYCWCRILGPDGKILKQTGGDGEHTLPKFNMVHLKMAPKWKQRWTEFGNPSFLGSIRSTWGGYS